MEKEKVLKMVKVAKMYYQMDYSQNDIAKQLGVSRPSVSRLLHEAKEFGIVKIEVIDPTEGKLRLIDSLKERYKLKECIIVNTPMCEDQVIKEYIGKKAAEYLSSIVKDGDIIGATWGTTLYQVAKNIQSRKVVGTKVVQLTGGISHSETNTYASEILHYLGSAFDTSPHFLPLPAVVDHLVVKQAIVADRHIRSVLDLGEKANIAIFTVGGFSENSTLVEAGYFTSEDLKVLKRKKAVGDICSRFFDINGDICSEDLYERTIGIDLESLKKKEASILVAGGSEKIASIMGALNGGYANVLITDQYTAELIVSDELFMEKVNEPIENS
ncbi:sugar-binding transcriptional regulator [Evansella tamaricis]|uniref:sugar-binding transcriptional regulator n=1 Tax=Evansella tamaricis TaxID=2069301 RepID=UPI0031B82753